MTRLDRIKNEEVRKRMNESKLSDKVRESRLRWYGHVLRRPPEYVGRQVLETFVPGRRKRGRPKRRWLDSISEDMREGGVTEEEAQDRDVWRRKIRCGDP